MAMNNSYIRDTARILKIGINTVLRHLNLWSLYEHIPLARQKSR